MQHVCFVYYTYAVVSAEFNYCQVHSKSLPLMALVCGLPLALTIPFVANMHLMGQAFPILSCQG